MAKIYIVNLDRDVEKLQSVSSRLSRIGLSFERFSAVLGKLLSVDEKRKSVNSFRVWCSIGRRLEDGELGCALSHLGIYRKMIERNETVACVLEDDVVFDDRLPRQIQECSKFLNTDISRVVLLSDRRHANVEDWCIRPAKKDFGTFAYMINLAAAKAILAANYPVQRPCDHWHRWLSAGMIELYHAYPTVCDYDHSVKSCTATQKLVENFGFVHKLFHKAVRVIGKTLDCVMPL